MRKDSISTIVTVLGTTGFLAAAALVIGSGTDAAAQSIPLAEQRNVLGDEVATYESFMMSGGPPPDGIPSIDEPQFVDASRAQLDPGDLVIGFHHAGEARAYPQGVLLRLARLLPAERIPGPWLTLATGQSARRGDADDRAGDHSGGV